jgi:hypothetical protein
MKPAAYKVSAQRRKVLQTARDLARSGQHSDHKSIVAHLELLDGFVEVRHWFGEPVMRLQLDRLCALARESLRA